MSSYEYKGPGGISTSSLEEVVQSICAAPEAQHQIKQEAWLEWSAVPQIVAMVEKQPQRSSILWHYLGPKSMGYVSLYQLKKYIIEAPNDTHLLRQDHWYDWLEWTSIKAIYHTINRENPNLELPEAKLEACHKARSKPDAYFSIHQDKQFVADRFHNLHFPHISNQSPQMEDLFFQGFAHCIWEAIQSQGKASVPDLGTFVVRSRKERQFYNHKGSKEIETLPEKKYIHLLTNRKTEARLVDAPQQPEQRGVYGSSLENSIQVGEKDANFSLLYWMHSTQTTQKKKQLSLRRQWATNIARRVDIPISVSVGLLQYCLFHVVNALAQGHRIHIKFVGRFECKKRIYGKHKKNKICFQVDPFLYTLAEKASWSSHV